MVGNSLRPEQDVAQQGAISNAGNKSEHLACVFACLYSQRADEALSNPLLVDFCYKTQECLASSNSRI